MAGTSGITAVQHAREEAKGAAMNITKEDMRLCGHKDEWGVDCLYLFEAQKLFADKLLEAAKPLKAEYKAECLLMASVKAFGARMNSRRGNSH
jgi:hypothetical protein